MASRPRTAFKKRQSGGDAGKAEVPMVQFRYIGFDQHENARTYKFDRAEDKQPAVRLVVTADLALFLKHHVNIQEGPSLCARKLNADQTALGQHDYELTDEDLLAFTAAHARKPPRRRWPPASNRSAARSAWVAAMRPAAPEVHRD